MPTTQPGSAPDRERTVRRKINPATCSVEDLLTHLAVDPTAGLSPKEAARRRDHSLAMPLFGTTGRSYLACLKASLNEPALWLFLGVSLISLFFDRVPLGLVALILGGGHAALCAHLRYRAEQFDAVMQTAYDAPLCRVRRGRRVVRLGVDKLVKGDVILLLKGDLVPADCRLLSCRRFTVSEQEITGAADRQTHILQKDSAAEPEQAGNFRVSPPNMVFAGGVVESGEAMAVVVSVGSETHLGGLVGSVKPTRADEKPKTMLRAARLLMPVNIALVCLMIPLVAVGIFTLGEHHAFLDIFLAGSTLAILLLSEHTLSKLAFLLAAVRRRAALERDTTVGADIKSAVSLEILANVTDVLLVGTAGLHDGMPHPVSMYTDGSTYLCEEPGASSAVLRAVESLYLCRYGKFDEEGALSPTEVDRIVSAFASWAEIDTEALLLKIKDISPLANGVAYVAPTPMGAQKECLFLSTDPSCLHPAGEPTDETSRLASAFRTAYESARREGSRTLILLEGEARIPRALFAFAPATCPKTAGDIRAMAGAGIRISAFLRDISPEYAPHLHAVGLLDQDDLPYIPAETDEHTSAVSLLDQGVLAFEGCGETYIRQTILDLQAAGRTVCVMSVEERDLPLLHAADLAVTCSPSLLLEAEGEAVHMEAELCENDVPDGRPDSLIATDLCRRRADVLVRRTGQSGGGVGGLRHAFMAANAADLALSRAVTYCLVIQLVRLITVILPLVLGLTLIGTPILLLSGLGMDTLVLVTLALLPSNGLPEKRRFLENAFASPVRANKKDLIMMTIAAILPWVVAGIAVLAGAGIERHLAPYGFLNLAGLQLAVFLGLRLPRRDRTVFFTTIALLLVYVGGLAAALASGLAMLWAILIPPIAPLRCVISDIILKRIRLRRRESSRT